MGVDPLLRAVAAGSPGPLMLLDPEGRIRFINRTAPGLTIESVLGRTVYEFVPPAQHAAMRACFAAVAASHASGTYENAYDLPNGAVSLWESRVEAVVEGGKATGFLVYSSDVTAQRSAERDRARIFDLSLDLLATADLHGYITDLNPAFERALGYTRTELTSAPFLTWVHPEDQAATAAAAEQLSAGRPVIDFENRYRCADGSFRRLQWRANYDAETRRIIAVGRDVTENRALAERYAHTQKMEAVGRLAGGIAHDLNNLLLAILSNVELAGSPAPPVDALAQIGQAADRAADLTRQLLRLSRREGLERVPLLLDRVVTEACGLLERLLPANVRLLVATTPNVPSVQGDRGGLQQVVLNLCLNARDALPQGGTIRVETALAAAADLDAAGVPSHPASPWVLIRVRDDGAGVPPELRSRIFEPFFTTKPPQEGTGLGLANAYGIAQQHGGWLRLEDTPTGASFVLLLPALAATFPTEATTPTAVPAPAPGVGTVLVAEDDPLVRNALVRMLEAAGYRVVVAADGDDAVSVFGRLRDEIQVLVFDIVMPKCSGPEAYARIAASGAAVPVLFSSGNLDEAGIETLPPGSRFLPKPYRRAALLSAVAQLLQGRAPRDASPR
jgi:PAS domain S-box-containing protein